MSFLMCLRRCAALALWAGVKLPGGQYRKRAELAHAHAVLRAIAAGQINARELPENQALLSNHERDQLPVPAAVFHLPSGRFGRPSAA